jgi:hypothetical protein
MYVLHGSAVCGISARHSLSAHRSHLCILVFCWLEDRLPDAIKSSVPTPSSVILTGLFVFEAPRRPHRGSDLVAPALRPGLHRLDHQDSRHRVPVTCKRWHIVRRYSTYISFVCRLLVLSLRPRKIDGRVLLRKLICLVVCLVPFHQCIDNRLHSLLHNLVSLFVLDVAVTSTNTCSFNLLRRETVAFFYAYPPQLLQCFPVSRA